MPQSNYYLSSIASDDIDEIITYLAEENPRVAMKFLDKLYETRGNLAENPGLGHVREDLIDKPVKFWPFKWHYLIIYKPEPPIENDVVLI